MKLNILLYMIRPSRKVTFFLVTIGSATSHAWIGVGILGLGCRTMKGQKRGNLGTHGSFPQHFDFRAVSSGSIHPGNATLYRACLSKTCTVNTMLDMGAANL